MSITTSLTLLSLILLFFPFKNSNVRLGFAALAIVIGVANLSVILSKQPKEQIYAQRIEIIEKAENSADPDVIKMAEQVRADIAKEQSSETQNPIHSTLANYEAQPTWVKVSIPLLIVLTISGFSFMLYKFYH